MREEQVDYLTVQEYADRFRLHIQTVYAAIKVNRLAFPVMRVGKTRHIRIAVPHYIQLRQEADRPTCYGGVYFVRCEGFIKIGMSEDVRGRLVSLRRVIPMDVEPLGYIQASCKEALKIERKWHMEFSMLRHRYEWFNDDAQLREAILASASPWPD